MTKSLRVGHYQCECTPGHFDANMAEVLKGMQYAEEERLDLITFPESFLTGYFSDKADARNNAFPIDGPNVKRLLGETRTFSATFVVGFNELRGNDLYNTALVARQGTFLGTYSKAFPCHRYFKSGRNFPIFECNGIRFGVIICADGSYIEPTRILAIKGAKIILAPHYNYIRPEKLIYHFNKVRTDHAARALENGVYFMRANNVVFGADPGLDYEGIGYGDSYLLDPEGNIVAQSRRHEECFLMAEIPVSDNPELLRRTRQSAEALGHILLTLVETNKNS